MEINLIYFLGMLAFNIAPSLFSFWIVWTLRRKQYAITWLRGTAVLIFGWLLGSVITFTLLVAAQLTGIDIKQDNVTGLTAFFVYLLLFNYLILKIKK